MSLGRQRLTRPQLWLLLALAVGLAVRVYRLSAQSLWNDEGTSVALARLSLPAIVAGAAHDIHPPLYYFLLHFWIAAAGDGEFALRFLSVLAGVLLIAVTYRVAHELFRVEGRTPGGLSDASAVGVLAAFLSAFSAFQVYYSQETRMYILVALWSALSAWALASWLNSTSAGKERRRGAAWLLYVLATVAALYTHYFAFALVVFENLAIAVWLLLALRARRPGLGRILVFWAAAQIVVALAFLPWLAFAGNQLTGWPAISQPLSAGDLVLRVLSAFVLGIDTPLGPQALLVAAFGLLFLAGLLLSFKRQSWGILFAALWAVVPLAAMYVVSLQRPAYDPKFLLLATPGFFILVARGIAALAPGVLLLGRGRERLAPWRALGVLTVVTLCAGLALEGVYGDQRLQRDDYRGIVNYINSVATGDDAVLVDAPGQMDVFRYYYRGAAEVVALPVGRPLQPGPTETALIKLNSHQNIFAVYWATEQADPGNVIEQYLSRSAYQGSDSWHGNVRLAQYAAGRGWVDEIQVMYNLRFGEDIELVQARLTAGKVESGRVLPLTLLWDALQQPSEDYKVFVHLLDPQGKIVSQRDTEPVDGFRPTAAWKKGEKIQDNLGLLVPPGATPGIYTMELGLYRPEDGARLPLATGGDHLILGTVQVENP